MVFWHFVTTDTGKYSKYNHTNSNFSFQSHNVPKVKDTKDLQTVEYFTKSSQAIVVPIIMHLDKAMESQMPKLNGSKRVNFKPKALLRDVEKVFTLKSLNQKVRLKLVNLKVINNRTGVATDENVSKYLKSYCEWQKNKKHQKGDWHFSVLLTGLDIYYVDKQGHKVKESTGNFNMTFFLKTWRLRGYLNMYT